MWPVLAAAIFVNMEAFALAARMRRAISCACTPFRPTMCAAGPELCDVGGEVVAAMMPPPDDDCLRHPLDLYATPARLLRHRRTLFQPLCYLCR